MSKILAAGNPPIRLSFARIAARASAAVAALSIGLYVVATQWGATLRLAGASLDPAPVALRIGDHEFAIPANAIRFPEQRSDQRQGELDLYLEWPSLAGFTEASEDVFHDPEARSLIFLRLISADQKDSEAEAPPAASQTPGPAGLDRSLRAGLAGIASQEAVYRAPASRTPPYEVSCLHGEDAVMASDCIRDIRIVPGLRLRYRFSHALLPQWDRIDRALLAYLAEHRRT